jgi:HAD superfamily hydrolase (TIGR01509 family)
VTGSRPTTLRLWFVAVALAVLAVGCQADLALDVTVEEDGSGVVRAELVLDAEATDSLLDLNDGATLPLTDLFDAGWDIGSPSQEPGGATRITAEKAFGTPGQFAEIMGELTGDGDGDAGNDLIRDFAITRTRSFGRVDYSLSGIIDPTNGLASFTDPDLEATLERTVASIIEAEPYEVDAENFAIELTVAMPGELQEDGSTGTLDDQSAAPTARWSTVLSSDEVVEVDIATSRQSRAAQVWRGVAVVAGVLAGLVAFAQLLRFTSTLRGRRRKPTTRSRPIDARGRPAEPVAVPDPDPEEEPEEVPTGHRVVALDGMGVLYREGRDVEELLIPFARERGSTVADDDIASRARQLSLGRLTTPEFWRVIGVEGDAEELDNAYLAGHQLTPGVVRYLRTLRENGVKAACITNDAAAWAARLRTRHSLEGVIDPWVVSGSVGVRKPEASLYEVLRRRVGEPPSAILVIDDELDNLDAAAALGFGTAWFSADGEESEARGHDIIRNFDVFSAVDTIDIIVDEEQIASSES